MSEVTSTGGSLTEKDILRFLATAEQPNNHRITLVAPNAEIAKQWAKQYPTCDILLSSKHLPTTNIAKQVGKK